MSRGSRLVLLRSLGESAMSFRTARSAVVPLRSAEEFPETRHEFVGTIGKVIMLDKLDEIVYE